VSIPPEPEYIHATASVSQRLAEAFQKNSTPRDYANHTPPHLHDFDSVFSKDSFDDLPESKPWDHAIELIPEANASTAIVAIFMYQYLVATKLVDTCIVVVANQPKKPVK